FGLQIEKVPGEFVGRVEALITHFNTIAPSATLLALGALAVVVLFMNFCKRVPGSIVALLLGTVVVVTLGLPVETIGTRFGGIPSGLPTLAMPEWQPDTIVPLLSPALTVALLGAIESLMSAGGADPGGGGP